VLIGESAAGSAAARPESLDSAGRSRMASRVRSRSLAFMAKNLLEAVRADRGLAGVYKIL
jgi:hypothetical protein